MAQLPAAFDSSQHEDMRDGFDAIPAAVCQKEWFLAHITKSSIEATKKKDGKYIAFEITIIEGQYKGRKVWPKLNIINPNPVAVEIAQKELATICRACGKGIVQDTAELHSIPFKMKLKVVPAKGDYPAKNEPTGYKPLNEGSGQANAANTEDGDPGNSGTGGVPWKTKG